MNENQVKKFIFKMIQVDRLHRNVLDKQVKKFGLYRSQHQLLRYLLEINQNPSQKEIANDLDISEAAITKTLKKLAEAKLIEKKSLQNDKRTNLISITSKGKEIMLDSKKNADYVDSKIMDNISDEDIQTAFKVLRAMEDNLIKMGADDGIHKLYSLNKNTKEHE